MSRNIPFGFGRTAQKNPEKKFDTSSLFYYTTPRNRPKGAAKGVIAMYGRHMKKAPRLLAIRGAAALILVLALSIFPFATVMANTVSANVIDGDQSYTFNMSSTSLEAILAQAKERGMEPLGHLDVAERVEGTTTVVVRRGVELAVSEAGEESQLVAYVGDTVEQALLDTALS